MLKSIAIFIHFFFFNLVERTMLITKYAFVCDRSGAALIELWSEPFTQRRYFRSVDGEKYVTFTLQKCTHKNIQRDKQFIVRKCWNVIFVFLGLCIFKEEKIAVQTYNSNRPARPTFLYWLGRLFFKKFCVSSLNVKKNAMQNRSVLKYFKIF